MVVRQIRERAEDYLWVVRNFVTSRRAEKFIDDVDTSDISPATFVLIPGIYEDASYFHSITGPLRENGFRVHALPELGIMTGSTADLAQLVIDAVAELDGPLILLSHSKGSLVGRAVLAARPQRVLGLIAFSAPWEGSKLARIFPPWSFVRRLMPQGSDVVYSWDDKTEARIRKRIYSIAPLWDPHIPSGSFLPGANNIELETSGHFRSLNDPQALDAVFASAAELLCDYEDVC